MYKVLITPTAEADIEQAFLWWKENRSEEQSLRWYRGVLETIETLTLMPDRCPYADEAEKLRMPIRQLLFGIGRGRPTHRILFAIESTQVRVLRVLHSARPPLIDRDQLP